MKHLRTIAGAALVGLLSTGTAWAGATLHIGPGAGTSCAEGGCPLFFGETNNFGDQLDIYQNASGAGPAQNPVLLILAVPNDTATGILTPAGSGTITSAALYATYPGNTSTPLSYQFGTTSYELGGNGFEGLMSSPNDDIYSFLGLHATKSDNMPNLIDWDELMTVDGADGIHATNFGIYVYAFDTDSFSGNSLIDIGLSGIPEGTFAVGFSEDAKGNSFSTPFTEAGLKDTPPGSVPEPSALALCATALVLFGVWRRRRSAAAYADSRGN